MRYLIETEDGLFSLFRNASGYWFSNQISPGEDPWVYFSGTKNIDRTQLQVFMDSGHIAFQEDYKEDGVGKWNLPLGPLAQQHHDAILMRRFDSWKNDPCWDFEDDPEFQHCRDRLVSMVQEHKNECEERYRKKLEAQAERSGLPIAFMEKDWIHVHDAYGRDGFETYVLRVPTGWIYRTVQYATNGYGDERHETPVSESSVFVPLVIPSGSI